MGLPIGGVCPFGLMPPSLLAHNLAPKSQAVMSESWEKNLRIATLSCLTGDACSRQPGPYAHPPPHHIIYAQFIICDMLTTGCLYQLTLAQMFTK